jgi:hypothetical protein
MQLQVRFYGGPRDGAVVSGCLDDASYSEAEGIYRWTDGGRIGARIWCPSPLAVSLLQTQGLVAVLDSLAWGTTYPSHVYEVSCCCEAAGTAEIRLSYRGAAE